MNSDLGRQPQGAGVNPGQGPDNPSESGRFAEPRSWWARASDELSAWLGNRDAQRRRQWDEAVGDHTGQGPAEADEDSDARILREINHNMTFDPRLDATRVQVVVLAGSVILNGAVTTSADKRLAEDLAQSVRGVSQVRNNLVVS